MGKTKVRKPPCFSVTIEAVCKSMEDAKENYTWCNTEIRRMDQLTQDYLHQLELKDLDYKKRAKVATSLAKCRHRRRECKDTVEILEPLITFLGTDRGKNLMNLMQEVLGKTRKVEKNMETRTYFYRIIRDNGKYTIDHSEVT